MKRDVENFGVGVGVAVAYLVLKAYFSENLFQNFIESLSVKEKAQVTSINVKLDDIDDYSSFMLRLTSLAKKVENVNTAVNLCFTFLQSLTTLPKEKEIFNITGKLLDFLIAQSDSTTKSSLTKVFFEQLHEKLQSLPLSPCTELDNIKSKIRSLIVKLTDDRHVAFFPPAAPPAAPPSPTPPDMPAAPPKPLMPKPTKPDMPPPPKPPLPPRPR